MSERFLRKKDMFLCFLVFAIPLFYALFGRPFVHYFYDAVAMRDGGTMIASLPFTRTGIVDSIYLSIGHIHGPVQFYVINLYYLLVGDWLGLGPPVASLLNVFFIILTAGFAYALGGQCFSRKHGAIFALLIISMPWLVRGIKTPFVYGTLSPFMHVLVLYALCRLLLEPRSLFNRFLFPFTLAAFYCNNLDWPMLSLCLAVLVVIAGRFKEVVLNYFNILPLSVLGFWVYWSHHMYSVGNNDYVNTILLKPFKKVGVSISLDPLNWGKYVLTSVGLVFFLAFPAIIATVRLRQRIIDEALDIVSLRESLLLASSVWFLLAIIPLVATSRDIQYGFVVALPVCLLAATFLERFNAKHIGVLIFVMVAFQAYFAVGPGLKNIMRDDVRVLAAAAYLNEERPDLLREELTALLPRPHPANVGQYARGRHAKIIMPMNFPATKKLTTTASPEAVLLDFVESFERDGVIKADWLILTPDVLKLAGGSFFKKIIEHPSLYWTARFKDRHDREMWLGEVRESGRPLDQAEVVEVEPLAKRYQERYNNLKFLARNLDRIRRY